MTTDEITALTGLPEEDNANNHRQIRRVFFKQVLSIVPANPTEDLRKLCNAWRDFTGAKWVWLWLFHPGDEGNRGHWELTSIDADGVKANYVLGNLTPGDADCTIAELANVVGLPIFMQNIQNWTQQWEGRTYRVVCAKGLNDMGCTSLLCVPLILPSDDGSKRATPTAKFSQPLRAAICSHFASNQPSNLESYTSLGLMGQLSARFVSNVYEAEERQIIAEMNAMAARFLTRKSSRRAADERHDYLDQVIKLVCEKLNVQYASVFHRHESKKMIYCVATNSLFDSEGRALMNEERLFRRAVYSPKDGLTGKVFATGKPYFHRIGQPPSRPKYKYRETPMEIPESELAWVVYPILAATEPGDRTTNPDVLGVIRCVGTEARIVSGRRRNLDPLQIHTLDFIVKMLAPVVETMAATIERERVISIIKHDLFAPLKMCRDFVKKAAIQIEKQKPLNEHFIPNLQFCIHVARNLAAGLDQSPTDIREFNPVPTKMEADIRRRNKEYVNSACDDRKFHENTHGRSKRSFP